MKSIHGIKQERRLWSLPVRGAWIEIVADLSRLKLWRSLPVRGAWIEIK